MRSGHHQNRGNKGGFEPKGHHESYNACVQPPRQRDRMFGNGNERSPGRFDSGNGWTEKKDYRDRDQRHALGTIASPSRTGGKGGSFRDQMEDFSQHQWGENGDWNRGSRDWHGGNGNNGSFFHQSPVPARPHNQDRAPRAPVSELEECLRRKGVDEAWALLEDMQKNGVVADKYTVSRMLMKTVGDGRSTLNHQKVYRGIALVESFVDSQPGDVDEVLFNALLDTCCRLRDIGRLEAINDRMRELKIKPSAVTLGILVKTYGQAGDLDKVLDVWHEMAPQRNHANAVTYGCMLDACIKCGNLQKAVDVFKEMKAEGKHKNTILYTTLIKGYGLNKDLPSSLMLFEEMKSEGVAYNTITYNSIIDVCVKCGDVRAAEGLMSQMMHLSSEVEPDLITFSTLLKGYCQQNEVDKALHIFENIKQRGLKIDELVYNTLMDGCAKVNDLPTGVGLFEEMLSAGMKPSAITHSILIRLYKHAGYDDATDNVASLYEQHGLERPQYNDRERGNRGKGDKGGRGDWQPGLRGERSRDWDRAPRSPGKGKGGPGRKGSGSFMDGPSPPQTPVNDWNSGLNFDESPFMPLDAIRSPIHDFLGTPGSQHGTPVPGALTPGGSWAAFGPMNMNDGGMPMGSPMNNMNCVPPFPGSGGNTPCNGNTGSSMGGNWFGMPSGGDGNMWGGQDMNRSPMGPGMGFGSNGCSSQTSSMQQSSGPGSMMPPWPQEPAFPMPMGNIQVVSVPMPMGCNSQASSSGSMGNMGNMWGGQDGNCMNRNPMGPGMGFGSNGCSNQTSPMPQSSGQGSMMAPWSQEHAFPVNMGYNGQAPSMPVGCNGQAPSNCSMPTPSTELPAVEANELLPNGLLETNDSPGDSPTFAGQQQEQQPELQPSLEQQQVEEKAQENGGDSLPPSPDKRNCPTTPEQYASYPMPSTPSPGGCHDNTMPMMGMNMMQQPQDQVQFMPDLQYGMGVGPQESAGQFQFGPVGSQQCQDMPSFGAGLAMTQQQQQMQGPNQVWMQGCNHNGQQMPNTYWGDGSECEQFGAHH